MSLDSPKTIGVHKKIIKNKKLLHLLYRSFYQDLVRTTRHNGVSVELGSGGGFIKEIAPQVITSDIVKGPGIDQVFSAEKTPYPDSSIDTYLMLNVFHHLKDPAKALSEMTRTLKKGGKIIMIEPWNSLWGRFIYTYFHHEDFDTQSGWKAQGKRRMTDANGALPWIIFVRDNKKFRKEFPRLQIRSIRPHTPVRYLVSGGLSGPQLLPTFTYPILVLLEKLIIPLRPHLCMFATIELVKV